MPPVSYLIPGKVEQTVWKAETAFAAYICELGSCFVLFYEQCECLVGWVHVWAWCTAGWVRLVCGGEFCTVWKCRWVTRAIDVGWLGTSLVRLWQLFWYLAFIRKASLCGRVWLCVCGLPPHLVPPQPATHMQTIVHSDSKHAYTFMHSYMSNVKLGLSIPQTCVSIDRHTSSLSIHYLYGTLVL